MCIREHRSLIQHVRNSAGDETLRTLEMLDRRIVDLLQAEWMDTVRVM